MKIYSLVAAALIVGCVIIVPIFVFAIANYEATLVGALFYGYRRARLALRLTGRWLRHSTQIGRHCG